MIIIPVTPGLLGQIGRPGGMKKVMMAPVRGTVNLAGTYGTDGGFSSSYLVVVNNGSIFYRGGGDGISIGEVNGGDGLQYNIVDGSTDSILCWWWKWFVAPEVNESLGGGGTSNVYNGDGIRYC